MSNWKLICPLEDIPPLGSRFVKPAMGGDIAIFRNSENEVFALHDKCSHKGGPLSQGMVQGAKRCFAPCTAGKLAWKMAMPWRRMWVPATSLK